jgi:2-keto-4-pentenoate hydratase
VRKQRVDGVDGRLVRALRTQLALRDALLDEGAKRVGWKLGLGDSERVSGHIAVGHLTTRTCLENAGLYVPEGPSVELHADAEVAVELGRDVPAKIGPRAAAQAIRAYAVALEVCDLRQLPDDADSIVAGNVLHRAVTFGPWSPILPQGDLTACLLVNGEKRDSSVAETKLGPRLSEAARVLEAVGEGLRAGDRIITSLVVQVPVALGDHVVADMGRLGRVALSIGPRA